MATINHLLTFHRLVRPFEFKHTKAAPPHDGGAGGVDCMIAFVLPVAIADEEIEDRKALLGLTRDHHRALLAALPHAESIVEDVVDRFFSSQMSIPAIAEIIENNDSLDNLKRVTRSYVLGFFGGCYNRAYMNARLRIGRIHGAVGVPVRLYVSALHKMETLLAEELRQLMDNKLMLEGGLHKLVMLDIQLAIDSFIDTARATELQGERQGKDVERVVEMTVAERTAEIERLAQTDHLTNLWNRRAFVTQLDLLLKKAERDGSPLSLAFIDLDDFKSVNDAHGHQEGGDRILELIGQVLNSQMSPEQMGGFRYGGDEFCLLLPGLQADAARARCTI